MSQDDNSRWMLEKHINYLSMLFQIPIMKCNIYSKYLLVKYSKKILYQYFFNQFFAFKFRRVDLFKIVLSVHASGKPTYSIISLITIHRKLIRTSLTAPPHIPQHLRNQPA